MAASISASIFAGERDAMALKDMTRLANRLSIAVYAIEYALVVIFAKELSLFFGIEQGYLSVCTHALIISSILATIVISLTLGILCALKKGSIPDKISTSLTISLPEVYNVIYSLTYKVV